MGINSKTDIIFIIDTSLESSRSQNPYKFLLKEIIQEIGERGRYFILHYNDIAIWDVKASMAKNLISNLPSFSFSGKNNLAQGLVSLKEIPLNWAQVNTKPIIVWLTSSSPLDNFQTKLIDFIGSDILFFSAFRIGISFGVSVNHELLKKFSPYTYGSLEIDNIINVLEKNLQKPLIEPMYNGKDSSLLKSKIEHNNKLNQEPEQFIKEKRLRFKEGIFACKKNNYWGWMGINGEQFISFQYVYVKDFSLFTRHPRR